MALSDGVLTDILSIDYSILERSIRAVSHLEKTYINILPRLLKVTLNKTFSQNLTYKGLLCLEILHAIEFITDKTAPLLAMSNAIEKRILLARKGITALSGSRNIDKERLFDMFTVAKEAAVDALILSHRIDLLNDYRRFQRISRNALVSSEEIVEISGIEPSAQLGKIILTIKKAHFTGKIASKRQALSMIKAIVEAEDAPKSQKAL